MRHLKKILAVVAILPELIISSGCWPHAAAGDNILITYEIDTVGDITTAVIQSKFVTGDSSMKKESVPAPPLTTWNSDYPAPAIIDFSKSLLGVPYRYGSTDPAVGFDCSGFITYVFNHFGLKVPRSSVEFTDKGRPVSIEQAQAGDLILFTGTDTLSSIVGHMGIVIDNADSLRFIHSSSGKANGVTITALNEYYKKRFVKVISVKDGI